MQSQKQALSHLIQFCACLVDFHLVFCFTFSIIYTFTHFFLLNFSNIKKHEHAFTWETLCNNQIFIKFIMLFQISSWYIIYGWTRSKYVWFLYSRSYFNLVIFNPLEIAGLVNYSIYLQLFLEDWKFVPQFPSIIAICLNSLGN